MSQMNKNPDQNINEIMDLIDSINIIDTNEDNTTTVPATASAALDWLHRATGKAPLSLNAERLAIFSANYGFTGNFPSSVPSLEYVNNFISDSNKNTLKLNRLCEHANSDLRLYELTPSASTPDTIKSDATSQTSEEMVRAMAYGMLAVEHDIDLFSAATFGAGSDAAALAIILAHLPASQTFDGLDIITASLFKKNQGEKGLSCLMNIGGPEISALCGAILSTRLAGLPMFLDGLGSYAALLVLSHHCPHIGQHCALTGKIPLDIIPDEKLVTFLPAPYEYISELESYEATGISSMCLIPQLKNEILISAPDRNLKKRLESY
ncbi:MAG: nicotinate-nucleotide--dimethylbenzimidazole phosphoribosyltransferase [Alphaproteobacteria bacterium]|nr:nicotinate-nucleotide--dimethylbenzimidazole phosphoribosyltransferase [Alphaproteobacteria bacterium]